MHPAAFDLTLFSALIAALAYTALVLRLIHIGSVRLTSPRSTLVFGAALLSSALWGWLGMAASHFDSPFTLAAAFFDLLRYGCWFAFLLMLLAPAAAPQRRTIGALPLVAGTLLIAAFGTLVWQAARSGAGNALARVELFEALALPVVGLILIEQLFRNVAADSRWNAKPLCLGLGAVFVFDLYVYSQGVLFGRLDAEAVGLRGIVHSVAVPLIFVAARRRSDWISRLRISRTAAFHSAMLVLAGGYLLVVASVGYYIRYFGGQWGAALQLLALAFALTAFAALMFSGALRSRLRVLVGKHFFSYQFDYREEWLRFTAMLSAKSSPAEMGTLVIRGMADMVESPGGAIWMCDPGHSAFTQAARWNAPALTEHEPVDSEFSKFLLAKGWVLDLDACRAERATATLPAQLPTHLPAWLLASQPLWLVVPLIVADELLGFVVLYRARTPFDLNWEVIDLLKTASRQAAGFLAQMRATEALLETRKFDAFNRMSAFVVHDLKNIVTQLSLMLKNAKRLHDNPEFQRDMLETVESSLEKMRTMMLQLREGEAPPSGQSGVELLPIVRRLEAVATGRGRTVEVEIVDPVVTRGHEDRIERVLGHVVQNALDATKPSDRVWLRLARSSGQAQVEVGDTGNGMSEEYVRTRLFKPFQTTKAAGMGIGAYESFQYVRELGGTISVDTALDRGTVMTIELPLFDPRPLTDTPAAIAR